MKNVITVIDAKTVKAVFGIKPNGAQGKLDSHNDPYKQVSVTAVFDLSEINPESIEMPIGILEHAMSSIIIDYQGTLRMSFDGEGRKFDDKYVMLEKHAKSEPTTVLVGKRVAKVGVKAELAATQRKQTEYAQLIQRYSGLFKGDEILDIARIPAKDWDAELPKWEAKLLNRKNSK